MRLLPLLALLLLLPPTAAKEAAQVAWHGEWEAAFREARESQRPVMVCINSKDGEIANERTAKEIYRDPEFLERSRKFVMIVVSTRIHRPQGVCPRFGGVTCQQHLDCWKDLKAGYGNQFFLPESGGEMISPQHAWFKPDGTLLRRKEYWLSKSELFERMDAVLAELDGKAAGTKPPPQSEPKDAPLNDRDLAELERVRSGDREARRAALGNLLETEKTAVHAVLVDLLATAKPELICEILRALGAARVLEARFAIEERLGHKDPRVRSFAAVALEALGQKESVEPLLKRARKERDTRARKNLYRALGVCGGGAADKKAAKQLLKALRSDRQNVVKKHAALALRSYEGEGAKLVVPALEKEAARSKDPEVRAAIVYTLAFIGNRETTLPVFERLLEEARIEMHKSFLRGAIAILRGEDAGFGPFAGRWLYGDDRADPARQ